MPGPLVVPIALGLGQILSDVFGNLFGASRQANAAKEAAKIQSDTALKIAGMDQASLDKQLNYMERIDTRDYSDWLNREGRDRTDWENTERRKAPYRALGDSAIRTLADYIRVPGMRPAQEVPVQQWQAPMPGQPTSNTMPVGGDFRQFLQSAGNTGITGGMFAGPAPPKRLTFADFART